MKYLLILIIFLNCGEIKKFQLKKFVTSYKTKITTQEREYHVYEPPKLKSNILLIGLHGRFGTGLQLMDNSKFNKIADEFGFLIVYPDGYNKSWADGRGYTPADKEGIDDVQFIEKVILEIHLKYKIDTNKVFIFGHSNGGFMTTRISLEKPFLFKAIGVVAASISENSLLKFEPKKNLSALFINGTTDPLVPYYGGTLNNLGKIIGIEESVDRFLDWNQCIKTPILEKVDKDKTDIYFAEIFSYTQCSENSKVKLIKIINGGHGWYGVDEFIPFIDIGKPTYDIDASNEIWKFFSEFL